RSCFLPLGMESGHLPDSAISASTYHDASYIPQFSRLNKIPAKVWMDPIGPGTDSLMDILRFLEETSTATLQFTILFIHQFKPNTFGFTSRHGKVIRVRERKFMAARKITLCDVSIVSFFFKSSYLAGSYWVQHTARGKKKVFRGNFDRDSMVVDQIFPPFHARFVRIHPLTWNSHICMRVELYGCPIKGI
ncbi:hypothetical protein OS493_013554, partial [Desmophyllum pertusum]